MIKNILLGLLLATNVFASSALNFSNLKVTAANRAVAWSGYHDTDCTFSTTSSTFVDPASDASCTFTERTNDGFGSVASYQSGGNNLPGVVFTPKHAGDFFVCAHAQAITATADRIMAIQLYDATNSRVIKEVNARQVTGNYEQNLVACGVASDLTKVSTTIKLLVKTNAGATFNIGSGVSPSVDWSIISIDGGSASITAWQDYTPTTDGFGTITIENAQWRRVGDTLEIRAVWENGTVNANTAYMTIPSGLSIDTNKIAPSSRDWVGWMGQIPTGTASFIIGNYIRAFVDGTNNDRVFFASGYSSNAYVKAAGSAITNSSPERLNVFFSVPISGW